MIKKYHLDFIGVIVVLSLFVYAIKFSSPLAFTLTVISASLLLLYFSFTYTSLLFKFIQALPYLSKGIKHLIIGLLSLIIIGGVLFLEWSLWVVWAFAQVAGGI